MEIIINYHQQLGWDDFICANISPASFLQSWEWGQFNEKILNNKIQRITLFDDNELKMIGLSIAKQLPFNKTFWYCPKGLIWEKSYMDKRAHGYGLVLKEVTKKLQDKVFLRVNPPYEFKKYIDGFIKRLGFTRPKILCHLKEPDQTWILDLNKTESELLANMHPKTRYNIRLASKKGITIRQMTTKTKNQDINTFCELAHLTAKRDKIQMYPSDYYQKLINYFFDQTKNLKLKLYLAEYQNKPLSAIIVIYFGHSATYLHGTSSNEHRNLMPNYLIQWQAIKDATQAGLKLYDFWGISEINPTWTGITRFKKGFGGRAIKFLGTWDYILNKKWYSIFKILRIIKKIIKL